MLHKQFQNRVLLTLPNNASETVQELLNHAILLIGSPVLTEKRNIVRYEDGKEGKLVEIHDTKQPCILYATVKDFLNDNGTYFESIPEAEEDNLFEYRAKVI